jgi:hypothetical protein
LGDVIDFWEATGYKLFTFLTIANDKNKLTQTLCHCERSEAPIKRPVVKRKRSPLRGSHFFDILAAMAVHTMKLEALSVAVAIADIFGYRYQPLLYQAPIRIKVFDFHRTR